MLFIKELCVNTGIELEPTSFSRSICTCADSEKKIRGGRGGGSKGYQCLDGVWGMAPRLTFGNFTM